MCSRSLRHCPLGPKDSALKQQQEKEVSPEPLLPFTKTFIIQNCLPTFPETHMVQWVAQDWTWLALSTR